MAGGDLFRSSPTPEESDDDSLKPQNKPRRNSIVDAPVKGRTFSTKVTKRAKDVLEIEEKEVEEDGRQSESGQGVAKKYSRKKEKGKVASESSAQLKKEELVHVEHESKRATGGRAAKGIAKSKIDENMREFVKTMLLDDTDDHKGPAGEDSQMFPTHSQKGVRRSPTKDVREKPTTATTDSRPSPQKPSPIKSRPTLPSSIKKNTVTRPTEKKNKAGRAEILSTDENQSEMMEESFDEASVCYQTKRTESWVQAESARFSEENGKMEGEDEVMVEEEESVDEDELEEDELESE